MADDLTPDEIRAQAKAWYQRQIDVLSKAHGESWEANREWVEDYLKEELRQRLEARGWRKKTSA